MFQIRPIQSHAIQMCGRETKSCVRYLPTTKPRCHTDDAGKNISLGEVNCLGLPYGNKMLGQGQPEQADPLLAKLTKNDSLRNEFSALAPVPSPERRHGSDPFQP
ncbi:hypothetical protein CEXT_692271 [Caerostris extrusa]|uniref:Uncharacterized protein n=1 Tax=Caerostris extrusa TaxID=172846 RepID=A0AAV4W473_CAEEX|nr:hypothetical protein CEXT_692271 [Caerostris extrusa]